MPRVNDRSDDLIAVIQGIQRRLDRLERSRSSSFSSSLNFDGDSQTGDPGSRGWALTPDRLIVGGLVVRDGIIENGALADPVVPQVFAASSPSNTNGSGTFVALATATITVPANCTRALVHTSAAAGASTNGTGGSFIEAYASISGSSSGPLTVWIATGTGSSVVVPHAALLTGLTPGGTFQVKCFALETTPANIVAASVGGSVAGSVIFLR